jgi:terminase, large subunit
MTFDIAAEPVLSEADYLPSIEAAYAKGLSAFAPRPPMTLDEWARRHFYLSAESSYVEQAWAPWPFQRAIMSLLSNDDVVEVNLKKSARIGYTKILLAFIGYTAHHTHRNQCIWQPTDDDAKDFVKSELEPMLRDVRVMRDVFPQYLARHKDNTLESKRFVGSMLRMKGAKSAGNFRRMSIDNGLFDEVDAMDNDVEKEGDPLSLGFKRMEGATFPKRVVGSTPKLEGFSLVNGRFAIADVRMTFQAPCPSCGERHALTWGGKDHPHGFKWRDNDPNTVTHLCPYNGCSVTQAEWLAVAEQGVFVSECGQLWLHPDGTFTDPQGNPAATPKHVALHVWTAYSPVVAWAQIVTEFLAAHAKLQEGDATKMQVFTNTTLGECWEGEIERTEASELQARAEPFPQRLMPRGCLLLLAGADTQDNRIEVSVWGYGRGGEMWTIDHLIFFGNPALPAVWAELEEWARTVEYPHVSGFPQRIHAGAIDSGGHHADAVYAFAHRMRDRKWHAVKGYNGRERAIDQGNAKVQYRWNGRIEKHGPTLWHVGTNLAKDRFQARLEVPAPGPGYVHLAKDLSEEWFKQLAGEVRAVRRMQGGTETRWTKQRARIEVKDCLTYAIWLEERLALWHPSKAKWWEQLEATVQPEGDLFAAAAMRVAAPVPMPVHAAQPAASVEASPHRVRSALSALEEVERVWRTQPHQPAPRDLVAEWAEVSEGNPIYLTLLRVVLDQLSGPPAPIAALLDAALIQNIKAMLEPKPAPVVEVPKPAKPKADARPQLKRNW